VVAPAACAGPFKQYSRKPLPPYVLLPLESSPLLFGLVTLFWSSAFSSPPATDFFFFLFVPSRLFFPPVLLWFLLGLFFTFSFSSLDSPMDSVYKSRCMSFPSVHPPRARNLRGPSFSLFFSSVPIIDSSRRWFFIFFPSRKRLCPPLRK